MKKYFSLVLFFFAFAGFAMAQGSALTEFTVGNLNYRVNDDNVSVTVIGHVDGYNAQGALDIPESVSYEGHDYAVTVVGILFLSDQLESP